MSFQEETRGIHEGGEQKKRKIARPSRSPQCPVQLQTSSTSPSARVGTASVAAANSSTIWLFSGRGGLAMDPVEENGSLWRYDTATFSWDMVHATNASNAVPAARSYHAMCFDGSRTIYLHAGCPSSGRLSDLWAFDTERHTWTELPAAPGPARGGASIAFSTGKVFRMGGFDGTSEQGGSIDAYDPETRSWSTTDFVPDGVAGPSPRSVGTLLAMKDAAGRPVLVTMFGECDPSSLGHAGAGKMLADAWAFDIQSQAWKKLEFEGRGDDDDVPPPPRGWFAADTADGATAAIVHGGLAEDNSRLGDVWRLDWA